MSEDISEVTRRDITDYFTIQGVDWAGRLQEDEFLARLYDLTKLPSTDHRISTAAGDIHQHRVSWNDWPDDWVFFDQRFNLRHAPTNEFLAFLCETVHPVVRPDTEEARELVRAYNQALSQDGWELVEVQEISGKPVFAAREIGTRAEIFEEPTGWQKVDRQLQEVRLRLDQAESEEQFQAVGLLCREVLITLAQEVYDPEKHPMTDKLPSDTDARRMLKAVIGAELRGSAQEEARAHAKAALRLANALQHKRTADFRTAALCGEATASVVNIVAILLGRRGRVL